MSSPLAELHPDPARRAVVVLGMHRSGTSAVAGSLQRLGIDFGPRMMPATPDNPRGYFEHIDLVNLHDRLLLALGGAWDETATFLAPGWNDDPRALVYRESLLAVLRRDFPPDAGRPWGLKDPRLCRLLPFWESLWSAMGSEPVFVLVWRPAREVAASLARREGFSTAKSYLLWLLHTLEAERHTRSHARVFLDYRVFLRDPALALAPVREMLGGSWPADGDGGGAEPFVDPALSRGGEGSDTERPPLWVEEAESALRRHLGGGDEAELRVAFDRLQDRVTLATELFAPSPDAIGGDLRHQLEVSRQQARWYEEEWRKTRSRVEVLGTKLEAKRAELERAKQAVLKYKVADQI